MENRNVCKFVSPSAAKDFNVINFILESDIEAMSKYTPVKNNRAMLIISGKGTVTVNKKDYGVSVGDLFFVFTGEHISAIPDGELEYMYISFSGEKSEVLFDRFGITEEHRLISGNENLIPFWKENLISSNALTVDLTAECVILYTFSKLHTEARRADRISDKIMKLTKELFSNPNLSIVEIGERLSYNPKYLSHLFKEETKMSYTEYLQVTRINYAIMLFENGIDSIKNVSLLSGFNDPFYFSVVFKKHIGVSPKEYIGTLENKKE